ncbi:hypothetical protein ACIA8K_27890 [Catenuloplanes sp. NPDC051500]|uniref:hypothetical protein n=1 Tax=Catenuloplanes sp. NPDC051500 TaxID=3363959 RepID=UPI0037A5A05E
MEIYTMLQIPSMSPALLLSVDGPVRPASAARTHVPSWRNRPTVSVVPQVDQVRTQAELVQDPPMASDAIRVQETGVSLVSSSNVSLVSLSGSAGRKGITGNKGETVGMKRAFGGARGVPPRGRPV